MTSHVRCAAAAVLAAAAGCGGGFEEPTGAGCMPEPTLYEWQALDARNVVVWMLPAETPYHLALEEPLPEPGAGTATRFVDGNRDGLICSDGWDSLALYDGGAAAAAAAGDAAADPGEPDVLTETATIAAVDAVSAAEVDQLRETYRETAGRRRESGAVAR